VAGAPDLVVEILSGSTRRRDEVAKRKLYARFGVREYWLVDPKTETVHVVRPAADPGRGAPPLSRTAGDRLTTDLLPGLEISLADVFA
jgi:Uma2 family endonuclease